MAARTRLDRKARMGVAAAILALIAVPALSLQSCLSAFATNEPIVASSHRDDRLVFIGRHTMVLEHGSVGRQIADWLRVEATDTRAFEIGDQTFSPDSVELTARGWSQLAHFAMVMKGHSALRAQIVVPTRTPTAAVRRLEEMRARRLRDEIVAYGVSPSRVTALDGSASVQALGPTDQSSQLLVLLSK